MSSYSVRPTSDFDMSFEAFKRGIERLKEEFWLPSPCYRTDPPMHGPFHPDALAGGWSRICPGCGALIDLSEVSNAKKV